MKEFQSNLVEIESQTDCVFQMPAQPDTIQNFFIFSKELEGKYNRKSREGKKGQFSTQGL